MDRQGSPLVPRPELGQILGGLDDPGTRGVLVIGEPGAGKTILLGMVGDHLAEAGRPVFHIRMRGTRYAGDLGSAVLDEVAASRYSSAIARAERTLRSSSPTMPLSESVSILHLAELRLDRPVVLLDGLDDAPYPERMLSAIVEFSTALDDWKLVVTSRPTISFSRLTGFEVIALDGPRVDALPGRGAPPAPEAPSASAPAPEDTWPGTRFRIKDLEFGAEEAERDGLLDLSYVPRPGAEDILRQKRTIVVGDRGAGKSAIFRRLSADAGVHPVTNAGDLLHKIVPDTAWLDTDRLRAAWLVIVASQVAADLPDEAPKQLRRDAAALRANWLTRGPRSTFSSRPRSSGSPPTAGWSTRCGTETGTCRRDRPSCCCTWRGSAPPGRTRS